MKTFLAIITLTLITWTMSIVHGEPACDRCSHSHVDHVSIEKVAKAYETGHNHTRPLTHDTSRCLCHHPSESEKSPLPARSNDLPVKPFPQSSPFAHAPPLPPRTSSHSLSPPTAIDNATLYGCINLCICYSRFTI